jgi:DNA primase
MKGAEQLYVSEGAREVMKLWQEGFPNAVGCLKATISDEQMLLITELAPKEVVLVFDGDEAGYSATDKNAEKLQRTCRVRKCYLPIGVDPKNLNGKEIEKLAKRSRLA